MPQPKRIRTIAKKTANSARKLWLLDRRKGEQRSGKEISRGPGQFSVGDFETAKNLIEKDTRVKFVATYTFPDSAVFRDRRREKRRKAGHGKK